MSKGARAVWMVVGLIVIATALAFVLQDGSVFTPVAVAALVGKFSYDGARDVSADRASTPTTDVEEEHGD